MILVIQRVSSANITINRGAPKFMGQGAVWLFGVEKGDDSFDVGPLLQKALMLRMFPSETGRMDKSVMDIKGEVMFVSQFTLCASLKKGSRPDFFDVEVSERAKEVYDQCVVFLHSVPEVTLVTGEFSAHMNIDLVNDGPVTFILRRKDGRFFDLY